jgi:hypothetical protein
MRIDESNPALVLPNGYVYGMEVRASLWGLCVYLCVTFTAVVLLQALRASSEAGMVKCVQTGDVFPLSEARRAFFM